MNNSSALDRAIELARSAQCKSVSEIMRRLHRTVEDHLSQPAARRELILLCSDAWIAAH